MIIRMSGERAMLKAHQKLDALCSKGFCFWYFTRNSKTEKFRSFKTLKEAIQWIRKNSPHITMGDKEIVELFQ